MCCLKCSYLPERTGSSSLSEPYWRVTLTPESRSPWPDRRFLNSDSKVTRYIPWISSKNLYFADLYLSKKKKKNTILNQISNCDLIPDAKARFGGFSMFKFSFPLDEDFLYGVSILWRQKIIVKNLDVIPYEEKKKPQVTLKTWDPGSL